MKSLIDFLQSCVNRILRIQIRKFPGKFQEAQMAYISDLGITKVLDVGANYGQFANGLFDIGYKGKIVSFEPLSEIFSIIEKKSKGNPKWDCFNYALGDVDDVLEINISKLSPSSSILPLHDTMVDIVPDLNYVGKETIKVKKLDSIFDIYVEKNDIVMLKIDTQGFEKRVLDGALDTLPHIALIQLEMSIIPMYQSESTMMDLIKYLSEKGFELWYAEPVFYHPKTKQLLQMDGIFRNTRV